MGEGGPPRRRPTSQTRILSWGAGGTVWGATGGDTEVLEGPSLHPSQPPPSPMEPEGMPAVTIDGISQRLLNQSPGASSDNLTTRPGEQETPSAAMPDTPKMTTPFTRSGSGAVSSPGGTLRPLRLDQVQQLFREGLALQSCVQRRLAEAELSIVQLHFDYTIDLPAPLTPDLTTEFVPYLVGRLVFARPGGSTDESRDGGSVFLAQIPLSSISLTPRPIAPGLVEADAQVGPARSRSPRGNGGLHGFRRSDTVETISDGDQPVLVSSPGGTLRHQEGGDGRGH